MKIRVVRSGGIAGLSSHWEVTIDDRDDRESWLALLDRLPWQDVSTEQQQPDRYSYRIECSRHRVTLPEQQLTGPWRELVDRVRDASD
ncbi:protealysin inhibitor emfourin [Parafrigoribacterium soli]|uniref:protealysin inhibitor emfourin n=1 Tax=Parafrigoribacterium soli TaxID=3144663 RepID=UPI0032EDEA3C